MDFSRIARQLNEGMESTEAAISSSEKAKEGGIKQKEGTNIDNLQNSEIDQTAILNFDFLYWLENFGLVMLWLAAILTLITGLEYFKKALPVLREGK